jgi:ParB-like chromosome segregation protein Spo0J
MNQLGLFDSSDEILDDSSIESLISSLSLLETEARISEINKIKVLLHKISPMNSEPVDCVIWVKNNTVIANDYNPNSVAPPEMELLRVSISQDGYTQPIVTFTNDGLHEVVDGFHRHRVGKECSEIQERVHGYLPVVAINADRSDKGDRIAATIRHNRARGKHKVESMSDIVLDLKKRNWKDEKIARELGMDQDEVLRLAQITGLAEMFKDQDFSQAWEADTSDIQELIQEDDLDS